MSNLKKNIKLIILMIVIILISGGVGVFATYNYLASDVKYTESKTVEQALDDLYDKSKNYILPSGTENITSNGSYNIANKESVNVNVTVAGTKTLLWTNSSPSSTREAFDINLSSSIDNFTHILVEYKITTTSTTTYKDLFEISPHRLGNTGGSNDGYALGCYDENNGGCVRILKYVNSSKIRCGNTMSIDGNTKTNYLIPITIYGLNFSY